MADEGSVTVADVIGRVESDNNPAAIRFELAADKRAPQYSEIIGIIADANKCTRETARMIWASSWGEFQIMGFNLYDPRICGYTKNIAAYLASSPDQLKSFSAFVSYLRVGFSAQDSSSVFEDTQTRNAFARAYNGPGNVLDYANRIKGALP